MKVVAEEELLKADSKGDNQEAELLILDEFAVLCRDLYAFYPMLIRYVDNNRYKWANKYKISGISFILPELYDSNLIFPCPVSDPGGLRSQMQTPLSSSGWWQKSSSCGANPTLVSSQPSNPYSQAGEWFLWFHFFIPWLQNFKREEQNFVVQNEINNLGFLTGEAKTKMSKVNALDFEWLFEVLFIEAESEQSLTLPTI